MDQNRHQILISTSDEGDNRLQHLPKLSRRQALAAIGSSVTLLAGCIGSEVPTETSNNSSDVGSEISISTQPLIYRGTSEIRYQVTDHLGNPLEPQTVNHPSEVILSERWSAGGITESNPFHMSVTTGESANGSATIPEPGEAFFISAYRTYTPDSGREVLLQYWELNYDQQTGKITGELTRTNSDVSATFNLINVESALADTLPAFLSEGATMNGTITNEDIQLVVQGKAGTGSFVLELQGQRSQ